jgi:hypothetical protein
MGSLTLYLGGNVARGPAYPLVFKPKTAVPQYMGAIVLEAPGMA